MDNKDVSRDIAGLLNQLTQRDRNVLIKRGFRVLKGIRKIPVCQIKDALELCKVKETIKLNISESEILQSLKFSEEWSFERKFPNKQLALLTFFEEGWNMKPLKVYNLLDGRKEYYRCGRTKCLALKCLFYPINSNEVSLYTNHIEHTNHDTTNVNRTFSPESSSAVNLSPNNKNCASVIKKEYVPDKDILKMEVDDVSIEWCVEGENSTKKYNETEITKAQLNLDSILKEEVMIEDRLVEAGHEQSETIDYNGCYISEQQNSIQKEKLNELLVDYDRRIESNLIAKPTAISLSNREAVLFPTKKVISKSTSSSNQIPPDENIVLIKSDDNDNDSSGNDVNKQDEWMLEKNFVDYKTAVQYTAKLNLLNFTRKISKHNNREYYKCKVADGATHQCPASCFLQYKDLSKNILMYIRKVGHTDNCTNALISKQKQSTIVIDLADSDDNEDGSDTNRNLLIELERFEGKSSQQDYLLLDKNWWILEKKFRSVQLAKNYVTEQDIWSYKTQTKLGAGVIAFYRCNLVKIKGRECAAAKFIHVKTEKFVCLFKNVQDHTHDILVSIPAATSESDQPSVKLDEATKSKIERFANACDKPKQVLEKLLGDSNVLANQNLVTWLKKMQQDLQMNLPRQSAINSLPNWIPHITEIPRNAVDDHKLFCISFFIDEPNESFRLFLSTRYLLKQSMAWNSIQIESSYELFWQTNRVTIIGTTDLNQKFHLFGIAISSKVTQFDYEFMFEAMRKGVRECHNKYFKPEYLIADTNENVHYAFRNTIGGFNKICTGPKAIMPHIIWKLSSFKLNGRNDSDVRNDILKLLKFSSHSVFLKAVNLFLKKWEPGANKSLISFLHYFKAVCVVRISNWFKIFPQFTSDSSIPIRYEYNSLRTNETFKPNLPVDLFQFYIKVDLENLSRLYSRKGPKVSKIPIIPALVQDKANNWRKILKNYIMVKGATETHYFIPAGDQKPMCEDKLQKYFGCNHENLDELFHIQFSFWRVTRTNESEQSPPNKTFRCNCPIYVKSLVCEHSLGMELLLNSNQ